MRERGERVAEFGQRLLLERKARFQFDQALFEFGSGVMPLSPTRIERPRPMP